MVQFRKTTAVAAQDRLTAVIALAAEDRRRPPSPCPSPEDLAALVAGKPTAEARRQIEAHLADCEECYALWCAVSAGLDEEGAGRRRTSPLLKPRNLTYLGSALALAATVVFYINLHEPGMPVPASRMPATLEDRNQGSKGTGPETADAGRQLAEEAAPQEQNTMSAAEKKAAPATGQAEQARRKEVALSPAAPAAAGAMGAVNMAPLELWLQQVESKCQQDSAGLESWWRIEEDGQAIKSSLALAAEDAPARQVLFGRVLGEVQAIRRAKDIAGQCKRIRAALAAQPEGK